MHCTQCGHKLDQTDIYCARCGNRTTEAPKTMSNSFDSTQAMASRTLSGERKRTQLGTKEKGMNIEEA